MIKVLSTAVLLFVCSACASAQISSLSGLSVIRVGVHFSEGKGTGAGASSKPITEYFMLDESVIQAETELRLREAGLLIRPADESSVPFLFIEIASAGVAAVTINMRLQEMATIERGSVRNFVTTWETGTLLQSPQSATIRERLRDAVSIFLNEWMKSKGR